MPETAPEERPTQYLIRSSPYAFGIFLFLYVALSILFGVIAQSFILAGVALLFTIPFTLLATFGWVLVKALFRMLAQL